MASFPAACSLFHMLALAGKQMAVGSASSRHGGLLCFYHLSLLFFCVLIYTILIFHLQPLYVKFSLAALPQHQTFLTTVKRDQLCHDGLTMSHGVQVALGGLPEVQPSLNLKIVLSERQGRQSCQYSEGNSSQDELLEANTIEHAVPSRDKTSVMPDP